MLKSRLETTKGVFWDGPGNFEPRSDDETDIIVGTPSPNFPTTPAGKRLTDDVRFNVHQDHIHGGSSVESGFEPGILGPRSRDLTTRPPWTNFLRNSGREVHFSNLNSIS
ncbi:hypothetical protein AVEN_153592-1 [Araneus ventricosus]|uniref:Uncharacterized protein n=1 Tax=Araneus ventricosus TaxID=182803 RepID=A0A4Y2BQ38_ARAVE|nr:hypothetical protein AVEN_153592-1 [Araneus ventricosus]